MKPRISLHRVSQKSLVPRSKQAYVRLDRLGDGCRSHRRTHRYAFARAEEAGGGHGGGFGGGAHMGGFGGAHIAATLALAISAVMAGAFGRGGVLCPVWVTPTGAATATPITTPTAAIRLRTDVRAIGSNLQWSHFDRCNRDVLLGCSAAFPRLDGRAVPSPLA